MLAQLFLASLLLIGANADEYKQEYSNEDVHEEFFDRINPQLDAAALSRRTVTFDIYVLTRIHPAAVCRADDDAVPDSCIVPRHAPVWSIHGLWPTRRDGSYPQFCDGIPKNFEPDLIKQISWELSHKWINLEPKSNPEQFWAHEYEKHGKCAQREENFRHEIDYFNGTLQLHKNLDIELALVKGGIVPRRAPYDAAHVHDVLNEYLGEKHNVQINCVTDRKTGDTMLADVRVCVDLKLKPTDCPAKSNQPVTEERGRKLPLPTYKTCKGPIVVVDSSLSEASEDYDMYMLTRIYPAAVCRADDDAVPNVCEIPKGTPMWSVHGLWPERTDGGYPQYCPGVPRRFDPKQIDPIRDKLTEVWPNLYPEKPGDDFWKHEYEKHGTCAQVDSRFGSELKYFNTSMELNSMFDVEIALHNAGIVPRGESYATADIQAALDLHLGKKHYVQMSCLTDKKTGKTLLADTRVCFGFDYDPVDCPRTRKYQKTKPYPLPSFKPCRGRITFLPEDGSDMSHQDPPFDDDALFFIHPVFRPLTRHVWTPGFAYTLMFTTLILLLLVIFKLQKEKNAHKYHKCSPSA